MHSTVAHTYRFAQLQRAWRRAGSPDDSMQRAAASMLPGHLHYLVIERLIKLEVPDAECQCCLAERWPAWRNAGRLRCIAVKLWRRQHAWNLSLQSMGVCFNLRAGPCMLVALLLVTHDQDRGSVSPSPLAPLRGLILGPGPSGAAAPASHLRRGSRGLVMLLSDRPHPSCHLRPR